MSPKRQWSLRKKQPKLVSKQLKAMALCHLSRIWHPLDGEDKKHIKERVGQLFSRHKKESYEVFKKRYEKTLVRLFKYLKDHI